MAESRRGATLSTLAVLFGILGVTDILKPFHLEGATTGLVFFGQRLSGAADAMHETFGQLDELLVELASTA